MKFVGRKNEINILKEAYNSNNFESILIYGRRRIGKSELIKESFKEFDGIKIYFECQKASEDYNIKSLSEILANAFNMPTPSFSTLNQVLEFIFDKSLNKKIILVIDEYPYLRNNSDFLDSIIQNVIDKYKSNSNLKFILCGSYIDVMEELLCANNPLYGRFSIKLNIKQMNYLESSLFYPTVKNEDKVAYYSVFGGVPYYNQYIDEKKSLKENIIDLIASPNARFFNEAEEFLLGEMTKLKNANECFYAIALGCKKYQDILNKSHVSSSPMLANILKRLIKMDVIERVCPINDESEKKATYEITERLSLFYYKYIFTKNSFFKVMAPDDFYKKFIEEDFKTKYIPHEFENISKQYFKILNLNHLINPPLFKIGKYYYDDIKNKKNGEFDVVTLNENGYDFYEVKFTNKPIDDNVINEEIKQLKDVNIKYNNLGFISKSGFNVSNNDYILITLDDIYNLNF